MCPQTYHCSSLCGCDPGHWSVSKQNHICRFLFPLPVSVCSGLLSRSWLTLGCLVISLSLAIFAIVSLLPSSMRSCAPNTLCYFLFHSQHFCSNSFSLTIRPMGPAGCEPWALQCSAALLVSTPRCQYHTQCPLPQGV